MTRAIEIRLSLLIMILAVPVHVIGLVIPSIYRDPAVLIPQNFGTDVVTLLVVIPLLAAATIGVWKGSQAWRLLWLGALGYLVYAYGMFALAVRWNELFLFYVALFGLTLFALVIGLTGTQADRVRAMAGPRVPIRLVSGYLILIAVVVGAMWLAEDVTAMVRRAIPPSVTQFETPTNIVHVFDLGIVLPAMVVSAVQLLRRQAWGYVLAGMLLVKAATIGLWVVAMIWFSAREGVRTPAAYSGTFLLLTVTGAALAWRFLASLRQEASFT